MQYWYKGVSNAKAVSLFRWCSIIARRACYSLLKKRKCKIADLFFEGVVKKNNAHLIAALIANEFFKNKKWHTILNTRI